MASPVSKTALWSGYVLSAIPSLMILFGSVLKFMRVPSVIEGFQRSGMPERLDPDCCAHGTDLRRRLPDSENVRSRRDIDDGTTGRSNHHELADWRPDLSDARDLWDDGLGRTLFTRYTLASVDTSANGGE